MLRIVSCISALVVFVGVAPAAGAATATRIKYVAVESQVDTIEIDVTRTVPTAFQLLEPHSDWRLGNGLHYKVSESPHDPKALIVQPKVANPTFTILRILSGTRWFAFELRAARPGVKAVSEVRFVPTEADIPDNAESDVNESASSPLGFLAQVADETEATPPVQLVWSERGYRLKANLGTMRWSSGYVTFRFELENRGDYSYPISGLTIANTQGKTHEAVIFPQELSAGKFSLEPGATVTGALRVSLASALRSGLTMTLNSPRTVPQAVFQWEGSKRWPKRGPLQKRLVLSVQGAGGAVKLDDGIGLSRGAWTTSQALGARVLYGASKHLSIEGIINVSQIDTVMFEDATWGADQGDLATDAMAGRVMIGGLLHTAGERWIPYARTALGVQLSRHSMTMGTRTESEIRSAPTFGFGGGLMVRVGKRLIAGASVAYTSSFGGDAATQAFEG